MLIEVDYMCDCINKLEDAIVNEISKVKAMNDIVLREVSILCDDKSRPAIELQIVSTHFNNQQSISYMNLDYKFCPFVGRSLVNNDL